MIENNEVVWPPKNWSLEMSGRFTLFYLSLFMMYMHLRTAIIYGSVLYGFTLLVLWAKWYNKKQEKELAELRAKRERLIAEREQLNVRLFEKFGKYTYENGYEYEYGYEYGKSENSEFSC